MPRHPPCALKKTRTQNTQNKHTKNKHTAPQQHTALASGELMQKNKMLASTIQFSHNTHTTTTRQKHPATMAQPLAHKEQHSVSSQTPNSAPTTNQHPTKRETPYPVTTDVMRGHNNPAATMAGIPPTNKKTRSPTPTRRKR